MPWQYKILISCLHSCQFFVIYCEATVFLEGLIPVSLQHISRVYQHLSKHQIFSSEIWGFSGSKFLRHTTENTDFQFFPHFCSCAVKPSTKACEKCPEIQSGVCAVRDLLCHSVTGLVTGLTQKTWHDFHVALTSYIFFYITLLFLLRGDKGFCTWQCKCSVCLDYNLRGQDCLPSDYHSLPRNPRHQTSKPHPVMDIWAQKRTEENHQETWKMKMAKR